MQIAICVITYKRPEGLTRLLKGLSNLCFSRMTQPDIEVILVDNDIEESGRVIYESFSEELKFPLTYQVESRRGISHARNRSVACVADSIDFIVFIDDDEVPGETWLEELLIVQSKYSADIVHGRVEPHFQSDVPLWVKQGKFFESHQRETGATIEAAYTNNCLIKASLIRERETVFDERFSLTGGEDSYLFRTLHHNGCHIVWANDAIVYEWIPSSRTTMKWILMRAYRGCLTYTLWQKEVKASLTANLIAIFKGLVQISFGLVLILPTLVLRRHLLVKALLSLYQGAGRISGIIGVSYKEYKTIHGT